MWWWRKMEKIMLYVSVRNEVELYIVKRDRSNLLSIKERQTNSIGHIFLMNCRGKHNLKKIYNLG
jgi:hypothetical protein